MCNKFRRFIILSENETQILFETLKNYDEQKIYEEKIEYLLQNTKEESGINPYSNLNKHLLLSNYNSKAELLFLFKNLLFSGCSNLLPSGESLFLLCDEPQKNNDNKEVSSFLDDNLFYYNLYKALSDEKRIYKVSVK